LSVNRSEVEEMKRKANEFLVGASQVLEGRQFDLSCFLYEQAVQLFLKSELLARVGDFPRTHSLRTLLSEVSEESQPVAQFILKNRARISSLEDAYVLARYSDKQYSRADANDAAKLAKEIMRLVKGKKKTLRRGRVSGGGRK
jgi:HEPN domain-containing protein